MKTPALAPKVNHLACLLVAALLLISLARNGSAQDGLLGQTPIGLAPGSPAGSYSLSGFDTINLFNGNLNFNLPLLGVAGRGEAQTSVNLAINFKWMLKSYVGPNGDNIYYPEGGWWTPENGYGPGLMVGRYGGLISYCAQSGGFNYYGKTLSRITFVTPDGTEFELRDQLTGGRPIDTPYCSAGNASRGTVFVTADGTSATFVSDDTIVDSFYPQGDGDFFYPSGYLMLRDGKRYRIDLGRVTWMRDRNGNKLTFTYGPLGVGRVTKITDSLNREVTFTYDVSDVAPYGLCDHIIFKGYGGAERKIRVSHTNLGSALRSGFALQTYAQLFPQLNGADSTLTFDPTVTSAVWLPNDPNDSATARKYSFYYNSYGELARVVLPTGGAVEYDWAVGAIGGFASGDIGVGIYRRVTTRREYTNGTAVTQTMTISRPESTNSNFNFTNLGYVDVQFGSAAIGKTRHYFHGSPAESLNRDAISYTPWKDGKEYKTEYFAADGTTVLRRVEHTFAQRAPVSWWGGTADEEPPNDPRTTQSVTTLVDTNQVTKHSAIDPQTGAVGFDQYNNQTDVYEYDYGTGAPGALLRHRHTDYLTTNLIGTTTYNYATDTAIHLRSLPAQSSVYDAAGVEQSRTSYEYDNYTATANHAALTARTGISGLDSAFTTSKKTRGNVTAVTRHLLTNGTATGSISTYQQYDVAGNALKQIDGEANVTTFTFNDRFGTPDLEAQANSAPTQLGTQQSYAFPSLVTNQKGHKNYFQRDYYTGKVVNAEDANGVTSSASYDDHLDRPTQIVRAANDALLPNQTTFAYDDAARVVTATSDFDSYNDATPLKSQTLYDGLGRVTETRTFETATAFIAVRKSYDALGRVKQVSNPFKSGQGQVWTVTAYDTLGRATTVTTPDSAVVTNSYSGNTVTVTDQTGKDKQSTTDALGRLTQVVEDPGTGGLGYTTTYLYDVLDNLRKVTQDTQYRYFMYDSLSRLIRVKHPEQTARASLALTDPVSNNSQWSMAYTYDNNGNPATRTDARGLLSTYTYDELNRNTLITYKNGTVVQARAERTYDTATNGVGRLAASFYYIDSGTNAGANSRTDINGYDALGRPLSQSQYFYANASWGTAFVTQRTYNLAGAVTSQTYPSGRTVTYAYDLAGRASSFTGNLGDGVSRNYATSITYDVWGGLSRERFGTTTLLYHKERRNVRGQLYDMRLSTVNDADNWNRGAVINFYSLSNYGFGLSGTDNNGNLYVQQHWVPNDDAITTSSFMQQNYDYDQLNRLKWMAEYPDGNAAGSTGSQAFNYDQFGNRTIDPASWGAGINEQQFTVVTAKNQLGVPAGQTGAMQYDAAGNLYNDTYSGTGSRTFDAENRMVTATNVAVQQSVYTYDADGKRVRRKSYGVETWQVYGMEGELLAEYASSTAPAAPQKEYGYRNNQLLVTATSGADVRWLVADHLGTPRIIADKTGSLAGITRHDYLPFGEELLAGTGSRTAAKGYATDGVRQHFTGYERDDETWLDYAQARYLTNTQGRFVSVDPLLASGRAGNPQSWNRYAYVLNNPLAFTDPTGLGEQGGTKINHEDKFLVVGKGSSAILSIKTGSRVESRDDGIDLITGGLDTTYTWRVEYKATDEEGVNIPIDSTETSVYRENEINGSVVLEDYFDPPEFDVNEASPEFKTKQAHVVVDIGGDKTSVDYTLEYNSNEIVVGREYHDRVATPYGTHLSGVPVNPNPNEGSIEPPLRDYNERRRGQITTGPDSH